MKKVAHSSVSEDFPVRVVDPSSETRRELLKQWYDRTMLGSTAFDKFMRAKLESGKFEKVWKEVDGRLWPAYRRVKP